MKTVRDAYPFPEEKKEREALGGVGGSSRRGQSRKRIIVSCPAVGGHNRMEEGGK